VHLQRLHACTPAIPKVIDLVHVEFDPVIEQSQLNVLAVIVEQLDVDRRMFGDDPFPNGSGQVRMAVRQGMHERQGNPTHAGNAACMLRVEQVEVFRQSPIDLMVVRHDAARRRSAIKPLRDRLALGATVIQPAISDEPGCFTGDFQAQRRHARIGRRDGPGRARNGSGGERVHRARVYPT
jgi:hypothetical protein